MSEINQRIEELKKAAEGGDPEAQAQWGLLLATGEHVPLDIEEALIWLRRAAQQGEITAMFNLGIILEKGLGFEPDPDEAALWYWQAAELGDTQARMKLGTMLIKGIGFTPDSQAVQAIEALKPQRIKVSPMPNPFTPNYIWTELVSSQTMKQQRNGSVFPRPRGMRALFSTWAR
jgi:TPR repeat protein